MNKKSGLYGYLVVAGLILSLLLSACIRKSAPANLIPVPTTIATLMHTKSESVSATQTAIFFVHPSETPSPTQAIGSLDGTHSVRPELTAVSTADLQQTNRTFVPQNALTMTNTPNPPGTQGAIAQGLANASGVLEIKVEQRSASLLALKTENQDQSCVFVSQYGNLDLTSPTLIKRGTSSSDNNAAYFGLNSAVLASEAGSIRMSGGTIQSINDNSPGVTAVGSGTTIRLLDLNLETNGAYSPGSMTRYQGLIALSRVNITTTGPNSPAVSVEHEGDPITLTGGILRTSGVGSPCFMASGDIVAEAVTCHANLAEIAIVEGSNRLMLRNSNATSGLPNKWGILLYQELARDPGIGNTYFLAEGGNLVYTDTTSPLFFVTNTTGHITLKEVQLTLPSKVLLKAGMNDRWGTIGSNGGMVDFLADNSMLTGDFVADAQSTLGLRLTNNTRLTGAVNNANTAKQVVVALESGSTWVLTNDSHIGQLTGAEFSSNTITNITGNGKNLYYLPALNPTLGGNTYALTGGGSLTPEPAP